MLVLPGFYLDQRYVDFYHEVTGVTSGENIKAKVKGIEESDVTPGFVLYCPTNPIKTGRCL